MLKIASALTISFLTLVASCVSAQQSQPDTSSNTAASAIINPKPGTEVAIAEGSKVAWDEFVHQGKMTWSCREIATGKFVNKSSCATQVKEDTVWPDKKIPPHYKGEQ